MFVLLSNHAIILKTLGQFENLVFVIMPIWENVRIVSRTRFHDICYTQFVLGLCVNIDCVVVVLKLLVMCKCSLRPLCVCISCFVLVVSSCTS